MNEKEGTTRLLVRAAVAIWPLIHDKNKGDFFPGREPCAPHYYVHFGYLLVMCKDPVGAGYFGTLNRQTSPSTSASLEKPYHVALVPAKT